MNGRNVEEFLAAGHGRQGEVANGRSGKLQFAEVRFGRTAGLEKAERRLWARKSQLPIEIRRRKSATEPWIPRNAE